jgi:hypothetical protein
MELYREKWIWDGEWRIQGEAASACRETGMGNE